MKKLKITRRGFLKVTGALGVLALEESQIGLLSKMGGAAELLAETGEEADQIIPTFCHGCGPAKASCSVLCHVKDGRFVRVEGNPDHPQTKGRLCAKGNTGMQFLYAPNRLKYPMKRVGAKGEGKFERITWDEALDTIADKMKESKAQYGAESYAVLSPQYWEVLSTVGRRFLNVHGSPNYLHSAICAVPRMQSAMVTVGFNSAAPDNWESSKLIVIWGSNCENSGVNQGQPPAILDAIAKGTKLIDIRPMMNPLGAKADIWLPIRPGTDCALALSFLNVIIGEKLYDSDFVNEWCYGFDKLEEHVKQYTPEWAAPITGIPAERITEVARMMGTIKPMVIKTGNGVGDQTNDGTSTIMAMCLISAITGNLDVPGGNYSGGTAGPSLIKTRRPSWLTERLPEDDADVNSGYFAGVSKLVAPEAPRWYQKPGQWESGPSSAYYKGLMSILSGNPYPIRVLNATNSTPLSATRNPVKVAEALKQLDFMFVMDVYWSPHVDYADIVLPACTDYERDDQFGVKNTAEGTWIGIYNKIAEPLGESRSDWQFYLDLAVACGYGDDFWNGDMEACLAEQLEPSGITAEELRNSPRGIFVKRTEPAEPVYRRYAKLFAKLPHGKVQCYNEYIGGKLNAYETGTLPYLPTYKGPPEGIAETPELAKEYPLIISDVHAYRLCCHSYHVNLPYLRELQPYPWVRINPETAKSYGIKDGDWMKVESPHGWIKMTAEYFDGIAPEVLMTRRGWWQSCPELGLPGYSVFNGGSEPNVLYNTDEALFEGFYSQMAKQTLVKISKAESSAEEVHR